MAAGSNFSYGGDPCVIGAVCSLSQPISPPSHTEKSYNSDQKPDASNPKNNGSETFWERTTGDPVAFFTFWLAAFTSVLSASTIGLWIVTWRSGVRQSREMNAHIAIVRESTVAAERAYVSVRSVFFGRDPLEGEFRGIITGVSLRNTRRTFTKHMKSHSSMRIFNRDIPENFEFPDLDERPQAQFLIAPDNWVGGFVFKISRDELISCIGGQRRIFVWGWADYNDVFPETARHRTEFCYEVVVSKDPSTGPIEQSISSSQYRRHNAADDECQRRPGVYSAS